MTALDRLLPSPRLAEIHRVDVAAPQDLAWEHVRHGAIADSRLTRALFALRTLASRRPAAGGSAGLRLDDLVSTPARPGFRVFVDDAPRELAVGAIGKVWRLDIPFVHADDAEAFRAFADPGFVKVAWAVRVAPLPVAGSHIEIEVRVDATDESAWRRFRRYFVLIGPASRLIRRAALRSIVRALGRGPGDAERVLPGDELLADAVGEATHHADIAAAPEAIWPWLVQMGCGRAGFYSIDTLDNGGVRSSRELHPELQRLAVGDVIPAAPSGPGGFEVLRVEPPRVLVLGGLFDEDAGRQHAFGAERPVCFWHVTWTFVLDPLDGRTTRLTVRARAAFPPAVRGRARWIRPVHHLMQAAQLRGLAARVEGRLPRDDWRDVVEGVRGAARMAFGLATPFLSRPRRRWGLDASAAARALPGDELVANPRWSWTHGIEIGAPAGDVWPWVAQIGADRGGFYSYQWLENLAGCRIRNAETIHPEWELREGGSLRLHPSVPALRIAALERGRYFVAAATVGPADWKAARPWVAVSWLLLVEPLGPARCRLLSRYRAASSTDLGTRLSAGPALLEPIGGEMDRRMLLGIKARAERAWPAHAA